MLDLKWERKDISMRGPGRGAQVQVLHPLPFLAPVIPSGKHKCVAAKQLTAKHDCVTLFVPSL